MKILLRQSDLSDEYLRFAAQIGADGIDIHNAESVPGWMEQGYPDAGELKRIKERIEGFSLRLFRLAPPDEPCNFMLGLPGGEKDIDGLVRSIEIMGRLGIPFLSTPFHFDHPGHRGGVRVRAPRRLQDGGVQRRQDERQLSPPSPGTRRSP